MTNESMSCLDVRRQLATDPGALTPAMAQHLAACEACRAVAGREQAFNAELDAAMQVDVPERLAARILLHQTTGARSKKRLLILWSALAVGVTAAAVGLLALLGPPLTIEEIVLAHINAEPHHLQDKKNVRLARVNTLLKPLGNRIVKNIGTINYAGVCNIRKQRGGHLVIEGSKGPVTVLLMPGEYIQARRTIHDPQFDGIVIPTANGSMAIVGEKGEALGTVEERLRPAIKTSG